jgi:hypothetical protein
VRQTSDAGSGGADQRSRGIRERHHGELRVNAGARRKDARVADVEVREAVDAEPGVDDAAGGSRLIALPPCGWELTRKRCSPLVTDCASRSTLGSRDSKAASKSCRLKAAYARRAISTFSCDIAYAVSPALTREFGCSDTAFVRTLRRAA